MNFTSTSAPMVDPSNEIVELTFDGTFYDIESATNHIGEYRNKKYPQRIPGKGSEQIFLHESTMASLFFGLKEEYFPMDINNTNVTSQLH